MRWFLTCTVLALGLALTGAAWSASPPESQLSAESAGSPSDWIEVHPAGPLGRRALTAARRQASNQRPAIVGGHPAEPGYWASAVAIVAGFPDGTYGFCTGSLFGARWVLTAAHCIAGAYGFSVGVGSYDLDSPSLRVVDVEDAWFHSGFGPPLWHNDIGFLRLSEPVDEPGIRLQRDTEAEFAAPGVSARLAGWGLTSETETDIPPLLSEITVPIVDGADCTATYDVYFDPFGMLCAGGTGTGPCFGDSGGPLVVEGTGRPLLAGLTSFGETPCGRPGIPDAFTWVGAYAQGIVDFLADDPVAPLGAPVPSANRAAEITETSAVIEGGVDPRGLATDYAIEYRSGPSTSVTSFAYAGSATNVPVSVELNELRPGTTYTVRVLAVNGAGETESTPITFRTAGESQAPAVRAMASKGKAGQKVALRYQVHDEQGERTRERVRVLAGGRVLATLTGPLARGEEGLVHRMTWKAPRKLTGRFRFCVESWDESGNASDPSCAPLRLR
jgi:secreted trypsin-like serine protease